MKKAYTIFLIMASWVGFYVFGFWHGMVEAERTEPPKIVGQKVSVEKEKPNQYETKKEGEYKLVATKTLVSGSSAYGFVGTGSCVFDYRNATKGYLLQLKKDEKVIRSLYCLPNELNLYADKIRYELSNIDSVLYIH